MSRPLIAVLGGSEVDPSIAEVARQVGQGIARAGAIVLCGGGTGVMAGACRGAKEAGGTTIGILPGTDRAGANPDVDIPIVTGMGEARNAIIVRSADAAIAIDGSWGTLSEIAFALRFGVPVVGLGTWEFSRPELTRDPIVRASAPDDAVRRACELAAPESRR